MVLYSIIMLLAGVPFLLISLAIYRGNTDLIHDYHQKKVTDNTSYGKAFGRAMLVISASLLLSGIVALLGDSKGIVTIALSVLFVGLIVGIISIVAVQRKYNNGIF